MNVITAWLKRNGCDVNAGGSTAMTHTIMTGGTLHVPEDLYDEFLGVYGREIEGGEHRLTYSEKRSPDVFRMYFDLDILEKSAMGEARVLDIVREVQRTVALFFVDAADETLKCVVSRTKTKEKHVKVVVPRVPVVTEGDDAQPVRREEPCTYDKFIKNGVHLNFPKLLVNLEIALQIRFSVVNQLEKRFGQRPIASNPWSDVIEKAPYFNGLKMTGSVKKDQCKACDSSKKKKPLVEKKENTRLDIMREIARIRRKHYKRDDELFDYSNIMTIEGDEFKNEDLSELHTEYFELTSICQLCNNRGWYLEDRYYSPSHVIGAGGTLCVDDLDYIRKDFHEQMRWTSIRARPYDEITAKYKVPAGHPAPTQDRTSACLSAFGSAGLEYVSPGLYREMLNSDVHVEDAKGQSRWRGSTIKDKTTMTMITEFIRRINSNYKNIVVREAMELKTGKQTEDTSTMIKSGAAAGMVVKKRPSKAGGQIMTKMAVAANTTIDKNIVLRVYTSIVVRVSGEGSKFCQNKGEEHTTNSVYFCISKTGACQMCHSGKDTLGLSGKTCRRYHSVSKTIPATLAKRLFPEEFGIDMEAVSKSLKRAADCVEGGRTIKPETRQKIKKWDIFL